MEDIFFQALDWVLRNIDSMIVETTKVGTVNNALSYMSNIVSKGHFTYAVIQGLGSNFNYKVRSEFANVVF